LVSRGRARQQRHSLRREPLAAAGESEAVGRGRPHRDGTPEHLGEAALHLRPAVGDPRLLPDQDAVGVHELPPIGAHLRVGRLQELERVDTRRGGRIRWEERADVPEAGRAENCVDQRMRDHVAVGVAGEAARIVEVNTAEDERHAVLERVRVDTEADAQVSHRAAPAWPAAARTA
jgi:hypothetical protein